MFSGLGALGFETEVGWCGEGVNKGCRKRDWYYDVRMYKLIVVFLP
jgi:hypothetical protein